MHDFNGFNDVDALEVEMLNTAAVAAIAIGQLLSTSRKVGDSKVKTGYNSSYRGLQGHCRR